MISDLSALQAVDFNWTHALRDVWTDPPYHVDDLNKSTVDLIIDEFKATTATAGSNPIGQVLQGRAGTGKTHLIGTLRRRVWDMKGWFVLIDIIGLADFWRTAALSFVDSLHQSMPSGQLQYQAVLGGVLRKLFDDGRAKSAIGRLPQEPLTRRRAAGIYLAMLREFDTAHGRAHQDVVRALIFLDSEEADDSNFAFMWLQGQNIDDAKRRDLNFVDPAPDAAKIVRGLLWIMSLVGPTMIAIDQIDAIVSATNMRQRSTS